MAAIDEKMSALEFTATSTKSIGDLQELIADGAEVAQGAKIVLTQTAEHLVRGVVRNVFRVEFAEFSFALSSDSNGPRTLAFSIDDYTRTRDTVLVFIPVTPWSAPAYRPLRELVEYVRSNL